MEYSSSSARSSSSSSLVGFDLSKVDALGDVSIRTASTGEPVFFRDLCDQKEGITVVALLRHFGCPCCWELASVLKDSNRLFDAAGVKLIAVGVGIPDKARLLAERGGMFVFKGKELLYARKGKGTGGSCIFR